MVNFSPLVVSDNPRFAKFQVKDGLVTVANEYTVIQFPVDDVFGPGILEVDDEMYFDLKAWNDGKYCTARSFKRQGYAFTAYNSKKKEIGTIIGNDWNLTDRFPKPIFGVETANPVLSFTMNFEKITQVGEIFGDQALKLTFDPNTATVVYVESAVGHEGNRNARAVVAGLALSDTEAYAVKVNLASLPGPLVLQQVNNLIASMGESEFINLLDALA